MTLRTISILLVVEVLILVDDNRVVEGLIKLDFEYKNRVLDLDAASKPCDRTHLPPEKF